MARSVVLLATCLIVGCASTAGTDAAGGGGEVVDGQAFTSAAAHGDLTADQSKSALDSMNDHCGDAWCEGDFDIDFTKLVCDFTAKTCTFSATLTDPGESDAKSDDRTFVRSCKMTKLSSYADLMETSGKFNVEDMTDGFFQKVDDCVAKVENSIPPAAKK